jgi:Flp pilus assembly protein TadG
MALGIPLLLLLIVGIVDFGRVFFTYAELNNGVAEGSRYAALDRTESTVKAKTKTYAGTLVLTDANITMVCYSGSTTTTKTCSAAVAGDTVKVTANVGFSPITPLVTRIIGSPIILTTSSQRTAQ